VGLTLTEAATMWDRSMRVSHSPKTRTTYGYAITRLVSVIGDKPIASIRRSDIEEALAELSARMKPATVHNVYRALGSFFKWAAAHEDVPLSASPMNEVNPPRVPVTVMEFPTRAELAKVLATTVSRSRHDFRARRDRAILLMFMSTGARLAEVAGLRVQDLDLDAERPTALVHGKGNKDRLLPLDAPTVDAIRAYVHRARSRSQWAYLPDLWLGPKGALTPSGVAQVVVERGRQAGVGLHPHLMRHAAIDRMLAAGMQEGDVMQVSGHSTRAMLSRYGAAQARERADDAFRRLAAL
jgi:integrase/recombinase XerD